MAVYNTGFWADHWTYLMDHVESYLAIYPDWEERMMYEVRIPYFFSPASVKPRHEKYVLSTSYDGLSKHIRQLDSVLEKDPEKLDVQKQYFSNATGRYDFSSNWQHDGSGTIFESSPMEKLLVLGTLKFATRDPCGMGIEYEGGRPGWDDANNGLVGMVGSGMPETFELIVLLRYIRDTTVRVQRSLEVPAELADLIEVIETQLDKLQDVDLAELTADSIRVPTPLFKYWDAVATARELVSIDRVAAHWTLRLTLNDTVSRADTDSVLG